VNKILEEKGCNYRISGVYMEMGIPSKVVFGVSRLGDELCGVVNNNWGYTVRYDYVCFFSLLLILVVSNGYASSNTPGKVISGWVEKVVIQGGIVKAKLDTGAKTSSIHAENIRYYKKQNKRRVSFEFVYTDAANNLQRVLMDRPVVRKTKIKTQDSQHERRGVISLDFCFDGRQQTAQFTLSDRSDYIYPVLLGRRFLKTVAVVDPDAEFLTLAACQ